MYRGWRRRRKRSTNDDSGSMERIANTVRAAAEGFGAAAAGQLSRGLVIRRKEMEGERGEQHGGRRCRDNGVVGGIRRVGRQAGLVSLVE